MSNKVKAIPDGYHSITPYLIVQGAVQAIDFYKKAFGATEIMRFPPEGNKVNHAEIKIGNSIMMLADECSEMQAKGPQSLGGSPVCLLLYVNDVDTVFKQAIAAGATSIRSVEDQFYGDRSGMLKDPFGHTWNIATHTEDLSFDEIQKRASKK